MTPWVFIIHLSLHQFQRNQTRPKHSSNGLISNRNKIPNEPSTNIKVIFFFQNRVCWFHFSQIVCVCYRTNFRWQKTFTRMIDAWVLSTETMGPQILGEIFVWRFSECIFYYIQNFEYGVFYNFVAVPADLKRHLVISFTSTSIHIWKMLENE